MRLLGIPLLALLQLGAAAADPLATDLDPAPGRYMVATRQVKGPVFGRSIVVLIGADERGAAGLIVNRPSRVPLGEVFDEMPDGRTDRIHLGGPVEPRGMLMLVRTPKAPQTWQKIRGELHLGQDAEALRGMIREGMGPDQMRAFVGHAGWAPGQLEHEIERGDWFVIERDEALAFEALGDEGWEELIRSLESIRAQLFPDPALCCAHDTACASDPSRRRAARLPGRTRRPWNARSDTARGTSTRDPG